MNESEYITDVPSSEESLSEFQAEGYSETDNEVVTEAVTEASSEMVTEVSSELVTEVPSETTLITSESLPYDMVHIQHNTDGIFLCTAGIFFLMVIWGISKFVGGFFSM